VGATPRRLIVRAAALAAGQGSKEERMRGPPVNRAFEAGRYYGRIEQPSSLASR
jgi:glycyl-tRNA synthetase beta subunit